MKIAFIIYDITNGGAEKVVSLLSCEMVKNHDVKIILFNNEVDYIYGGDIIDLNVPSKKGIINQFINIFFRAYKLNKVFKEEKFDKVFSFMESANIPSLLVNKDTVVSIRNNPLQFDIITQSIIKILYKKAKKIVVNSLVNKKILQDEFRLSNVDVIYNPLNIEDINGKSKENIDIKHKFIVAIGRLHYQKGFDLLIEAYSNSKIPKDTKLLIFGDGSLKEELQEQIENLGLQKSILLMGRTSNPYKYLSRAKIFVLSSRYEGFPNALIESMACSCPSIAFDCKTGPNEIITHKKNGLLVNEENTSELIKTMDDLYFDEELQKIFSINSSKSIAYLNIKEISEQWMKI